MVTNKAVYNVFHDEMNSVLIIVVQIRMFVFYFGICLKKAYSILDATYIVYG